MQVSVVLASYNGARFIGEQLESLARQTRLPDELVVCDDGSSDETMVLAEQFAASAPFAVRIERNPENLGFSGNFEKLLSLARGDTIFISDQDDIWYPEKIARVLAELDLRSDATMIVNDEHLMDADGRQLNATFLGNVRKLGYPDSYHSAGCCAALRRDLLPLVLPFHRGLNYDQWISMMADLLGAKAVLDIPLQLYRRHDRNSTDTILAEEKASVWGLARAYGFADPRLEWRRQIGSFQACRARIEERRPVAEALVGSERVDAALKRIDEQTARLSRRLALLAKPRPSRLPAVLSLWRRGFYSHFAGSKSAIKDILRR
jgi:glycosyltransferase involved in cell wall biosynthesis